MTRVSEALRHLRRVMPWDGAGLTDGQLLERYLSGRDEAAMEALVRRHGAMVWGTVRRVLRHPHDAEDAFQATFLVLARKAASILPRERLANWLYGVARQTALKARATAARRKGRERQVTEMPEPAAPEPGDWNDVAPLLDRELSLLPDYYRAVIVLCDLEGRARKEAAGQLGVPEGTVAGRLARARALLVKRLTRRGVALSGGALAALLARSAASGTLPASVASSTGKIATLYAAGQAAGLIPANVAALTEGVLKAMLLKKLKIAAVVLLLVVFGALLGAAGASRAEQAAAPVAPRQKQEGAKQAAKVKWEYKAISPHGIEQLAPKGSKDKLTDGLNALGDQGWELVAISPGKSPGGGLGGTISTYVFKRPK
jgi:RNA polymerase sigma factor (sigma-70 family)